ncbi:MAG: YceI family protein [Pseudomonadota bacterium]
MKPLFVSAALAAALATTALADAESFVLDPTHSAIKFEWSHAGFSTTFGAFFEVNGSIEFDQNAPENSSVSVEFPLASMVTDPSLIGHLSGDRWFGGLDGKAVTFTSTGIEVTGDNTALITGDLSLNGQTAEVVLDTVMNNLGPNFGGTTVAGFTATTSVLRSDFGVGAFAPAVGDELGVTISIEASPAS